jgi:small subunit ribosomal protein S3
LKKERTANLKKEKNKKLMGQKVNPNGLRLGINKTWSSRWYSKTDYARLLHEDLEIKKYIQEKLASASISKVIIERAAKKLRLTVYSSRPGIIIGKKGIDIESLKNKLTEMSKLEVYLDIKEVRKPEVEAKLVAENIASQLEKRISFRRAMKKAVQSAMRLGAKGIKVVCSGRLGGAEIARTEKYHLGSVPLHTLRTDIDYATAEAETTYGICGIKVWINRGEILSKDPYGSEKNQIEQGNIR